MKAINKFSEINCLCVYIDIYFCTIKGIYVQHSCFLPNLGLDDLCITKTSRNLKLREYCNVNMQCEYKRKFLRYKLFLSKLLVFVSVGSPQIIKKLSNSLLSRYSCLLPTVSGNHNFELRY